MKPVRHALLLLAAVAPLARAQTPTPPTTEPPPLLAVGETVPPFEATDLSGNVKEVKYAKPTVLLFFLSSCPHCHKMLPEWSKAFDRRPATLEVVGVLMDREPPGFFAAMPVTFPVVRAPTREFGRIFKVSKVPLTLRVAKGGKVEDIAQGEIDPIRIGEMFRR